MRIANARIVFITHGQASDPFWTVVKRGLERRRSARAGQRCPTARRTGSRSSACAASSSEAIADKPDGIVVWLPDVEALRADDPPAVGAGIPVVTINSGSDKFKSLGVLAHIGQPEYEAGVESGERMAARACGKRCASTRRSGNSGLDERCRGFADGLRQLRRQVARAAGPAAGPGARHSGGWRGDRGRARRRHPHARPGRREPAIDAVSASGMTSKIKLATFDLSPDVLTAVRDGKMLFAVDQQPYLQGSCR